MERFLLEARDRVDDGAVILQVDVAGKRHAWTGIPTASEPRASLMRRGAGFHIRWRARSWPEPPGGGRWLDDGGRPVPSKQHRVDRGSRMPTVQPILALSGANGFCFWTSLSLQHSQNTSYSLVLAGRE